MPEELATTFIEKAIAREDGFAVDCKVVYEQEGAIGGPRHYEDFRIKE